jgi:hypothetical protein
MAIAMEVMQNHFNLQIKTSKSMFVPKQVFLALGQIWNTRDMTVSLPVKRLVALKSMARRLLQGGGWAVESDGRATPTATTLKLVTAPDGRAPCTPIKTKDLARFVGSVVAASEAIPMAVQKRVHVQHCLSRAVKRRGWNSKLYLTAAAMQILAWWATTNLHEVNGSPLRQKPKSIKLVFGADAASTLGWGAWLKDSTGRQVTTRGLFSREEQMRHINYLEGLAQLKGLQALLLLLVPRSQWHLVEVTCLCDNTPWIRYGNRIIGPSLPLSLLGIEFHEWRLETLVSTMFKHIAGEIHYLADKLSRVATDFRDWILNNKYLLPLVFNKWGRPRIDLFAAANNAKATLFCSYLPDGGAAWTDAFSASWSGKGRLYAYPPYNQIAKVLRKVQEEQVNELILIAPAWQSQAWWPHLLAAAADFPVVLPAEHDLVQPPTGSNRWSRRWEILAWNISGTGRVASTLARARSKNSSRNLSTVTRQLTTSLGKSSTSGTFARSRLISAIARELVRG